MKAFIGKALIAVAVAVVLANPPRKPLVKCECGTSNDPDVRSSCMTCGRPV